MFSLNNTLADLGIARGVASLTSEQTESAAFIDTYFKHNDFALAIIPQYNATTAGYLGEISYILGTGADIGKFKIKLTGASTGGTTVFSWVAIRTDM